jgi:PAS domain S-box-containing protein
VLLAQASAPPRDQASAFRGILDSLPDSVLVVDLTDTHVPARIVYANEAFLQMFGFVRDDLSKARLEDCAAPEYRDHLRDCHERCVRGGGAATRFEFQGQREDGGRIWVEMAVTAVAQDGRVVGTQSLIRDITRHKEAEQTARRLNENLRLRVTELTAELQMARRRIDHEIAECHKTDAFLRQAQQRECSHQVALAQTWRMAAVAGTATAVTHELGQPLAAIMGYADAALNHLDTLVTQVPSLRQWLQGILEQVDRASEVTSRLRGLMRRRRAQRVLADVAEIVRAAAEAMGARVQARRARLSVAVAPSPLVASVDPLLIQVVLLNLMRNAVDACEQVPDERREVAVRAWQNEQGCVQVAVSDRGVGITPGTEQSIFDPFFSTKPNGFGVGLFVSRWIIEGHDGRLWAEPHEPEGTVLSFTLPFWLDGGNDGRTERADRHADRLRH